MSDFVGPDCACAYCGQRIRMYGSQFSNVNDGEWHTCPFDTAMHVGGMYLDGHFAFFDYRASTPTERPTP